MHQIWLPRAEYLFRSDYHDLWYAAEIGALAGRRTSKPYRDIVEMQQEMREFGQVLQANRSKTPRLIFDVRGSPSRSDPEFEQAFIPLRKKAFQGFVRVAVLARTAVGAMQLQRHRDEANDAVRIFMDDVAALGWIRSAD